MTGPEAQALKQRVEQSAAYPYGAHIWLITGWLTTPWPRTTGNPSPVCSRLLELATQVLREASYPSAQRFGTLMHRGD